MELSTKIAFRSEVLILKLADIQPLKEELTPAQRRDKKYQQILSSVTYIGLVEPLVVFPNPEGKYWLVDGHRRLDALKYNHAEEVRCLLATDDESYTYNKRVNYLPPIGEHYMILKALANGVTEERIALALSVDVSSIRRKRDMLNGICSEVAELLKTKRVTDAGFSVIRKMKPVRQIKCAQLMISASNYSVTFAKAFLDVTPDELLTKTPSLKRTGVISHARKSLIEEETDVLLKDLKHAEDSYGSDMLDLVTSCRYVGRLLGNVRIRRYLSNHHSEMLTELDQLVAEVDKQSVQPLAKAQSKSGQAKA
jgi:hypothetical protein